MRFLLDIKMSCGYEECGVGVRLKYSARISEERGWKDAWADEMHRRFQFSMPCGPRQLVDEDPSSILDQRMTI